MTVRRTGGCVIVNRRGGGALRPFAWDTGDKPGTTTLRAGRVREMADRESRRQQRGAVAVSGKAAANGRVAKRDSDEIVAEIERTRQNLARTIDSLADRVSPASNVRRLRERAASELSRPEVQVAALAAALAATGFAVYRIWARRRG
jgi:energy-coupling factor transporter ATP-binding protein EcfA2